MLEQPVAYDETKDPDIFWQPDPCDDCLPKTKGFITDLVYAGRGKESPTLFTLWQSLFDISAAVKREAWLKEGDVKLFSNIYVLLTAPAGVVRKNTSIRSAIKLLDFLDLEIDDPNIAAMKMINPFRGKATEKGLVHAMLPGNHRGPTTHTFVNPDGSEMVDAKGKPIKYKQTSELSLCLGELSVAVSKQAHMEGLLELFLMLYDNEDSLPYLTQERGVEELRSMCTSILAALTPTALKETLPTTIVGDGFLSRAILVFQDWSEREFHRQRSIENAPKRMDLRKRLAWIASNTFGEWDFTPEADRYLAEWYHEHRINLKFSGRYQGVMGRRDDLVKKLSCLIQWQQYDRSTNNKIELQSVVDAVYLMRRTFSESAPLYRMIFNNVGNDATLKAERYIQKMRKVSRIKLMQATHISAEDVNVAVYNLVQEGRVIVWRKEKAEADTSKQSGEEYEWIGEPPIVRTEIYTKKDNVQYNHGESNNGTERTIGWKDILKEASIRDGISGRATPDLRKRAARRKDTGPAAGVDEADIQDAEGAGNVPGSIADGMGEDNESEGWPRTPRGISAVDQQSPE